MIAAVALPLAVTTGVVIIAVAAAVVLVVLIVALSMRGRQLRAETRREAERRERVGPGHELQPADDIPDDIPDDAVDEGRPRTD